MSDIKHCKDCKFGVQNVGERDRVCYLKPPVVMFNDNMVVFTSRRPIVRDLDFCKEWYSK